MTVAAPLPALVTTVLAAHSATLAALARDPHPRLRAGLQAGVDALDDLAAALDDPDRAWRVLADRQRRLRELAARNHTDAWYVAGLAWSLFAATRIELAMRGRTDTCELGLHVSPPVLDVAAAPPAPRPGRSA